MVLYEMEMEFELELSLKSINNFMNDMGMDGKLVSGGHIFTISQTIPFVPDEAYLEKVIDVIKKHYNKDRELEVVSCTFKGYKKFIEKKIEEAK